MLGTTQSATPLILLGLGQIGRALGRTLAMRVPSGGEPSFCIVGLADRSGVLAATDGFSQDELRSLLLAKEAGQSLRDEEPGDCSIQEDLLQALDIMIFSRMKKRGILIDLTADETCPVLLKALESGWSCVLANKKPLCNEQWRYQELFEAAKKSGAQLKHSATVGVGVPILQVIDDLEQRGEAIDRIEASLSGTVAFIMAELEAGATFNEAVSHAKALGYTEPDPTEDLSGQDVLRKALIVARRLGQKLEFGDIVLQGVNESSFSAPPKNGEVLRYLATIDQSKVKVGVETVSESSPIARMRAGEQLVVIRVAGREHPLVLRGQGTGAELTSRVVLNDILAIERSKSPASASH